MTKSDADILAAEKRKFAKRLRDSESVARLTIASDDSDKAVAAIWSYTLLLSSERRAEETLPLLESSKPAVFWKAFYQCWSNFDNTWQFMPRLLLALRRNASKSSPHSYMPEGSSKIFSSLPDAVRVFRGCSQERVAGISWSLSRDVANGFARGHRGISVPYPVIAEATISKPYIFALIASRSENEIVLDPNKLVDINVSSVEK